MEQAKVNFMEVAICINLLLGNRYSLHTQVIYRYTDVVIWDTPKSTTWVTDCRLTRAHRIMADEDREADERCRHLVELQPVVHLCTGV